MFLLVILNTSHSSTEASHSGNTLHQLGDTCLKVEREDVICHAFFASGVGIQKPELISSFVCELVHAA